MLRVLPVSHFKGEICTVARPRVVDIDGLELLGLVLLFCTISNILDDISKSPEHHLRYCPRILSMKYRQSPRGWELHCTDVLSILICMLSGFAVTAFSILNAEKERKT